MILFLKQQTNHQYEAHNKSSTPRYLILTTSVNQSGGTAGVVGGG